MGSPGWVRPPDPSPCCVPRRASPNPHFPGPAWLATHRPPPGLPGLSTLPHSSAQPDPWGRPSRGTPVLSLCRPFPLGSLPSRKPPPLPCRSPSLPQRVLKPLPLQASRIRQLAPSRICRALDPKAQPGPLPGRPGPVLPLPLAFPVWIDQPPPISLASSDRLAHGCLRGVVGLRARADASPGDVALSLAPHTGFRPSTRTPSVVASRTGKCQARGLGPKDCLLRHTGRGHRHGTPREPSRGPWAERD